MEVSRTIKEDKSLRKYIALPKAEIEELLTFLLERIKIIPEEEYTSLIEKATGKVPWDDVPYLASALALNIPIWSNDSAFKK
jgi:predicted nucleic acid-binding protein